MKTLRKKATSVAAVALLTGLASASVFAADTPTNPEDTSASSPIAANVTVVNDYRYRGISQSNFKPAIQGGFDYAHESGFYIGNWNSSISWISDAYSSTGSSAASNPTRTSVSSSIEMDFYAGFKKELLGAGFASDLGLLQYYYPTSGLPNNAVNPNTTEVYAAQNFTAGPVTGFVKFSYALTNTFGNANSRGSYYPDLTVNYDTGVWGLALNGHVGYQYIAGTPGGTTVTNSSLYTYTDWKAGITKDFGGGLSGSLAYVGTNANPSGYYSPQGKNLGKSTGLVSLTKTF